MLLVETIVDKAIKVCGGQKELAARLGITQPDVSALRSGKRPLSPEIAAEMADVAGMDAREAAISAIIFRARGTRKEGAMRDILGKGLVAGVAALLAGCYSPTSYGSTDHPKPIVKNCSHSVNNLYIVSTVATFCRDVLKSLSQILRYLAPARKSL